MTEKNRLSVKDGARHLCDELAQVGLNLPYMKALDICAQLEGYLDWREYERLHIQQAGSTQLVRVVYLNGFSDKGYWWTRAVAEPWLTGTPNIDYSGPFSTVDQALAQAKNRFPNALVMPHEQGLPGGETDAGWQRVSVYATIRLFFPSTSRVTRVMHNPYGDDAQQMNERLEFTPRYSMPDGRIEGVTYRSGLKFLRFDTVRRCAAFEFEARLDVSKPSGTGLPELVDKFRFHARLSDTYEEPDIELVSWE
jgi:hypothetical protein